MKIVNCSHDAHAASILALFNDAIVNSTALYDYVPRPAKSMVGWFKTKEEGAFPVIGVESEEGQLLGFASYGAFRAWPAYKYSVEHGIYIHKDHHRKGLGRLLMERLIERAREQEYHVLIGGIDMGNTSSIALHQLLGFAHAGTVLQAGFKFGRWLDLGLYQLLLDTPREPRDG